MAFEIIFLESVTKGQKASVQHFVDMWHTSQSVIPVHTSGSTGTPKKIMISKTRMAASARATGHYFNFKKGQKNLLALSSDYIAGMMQIVRSIVFDMSLVVAPLTTNPLDAYIDSPIDFAAFVPMQVEAILADKLTKKRYEAIPHVIIGGAPVSQALFKDIGQLQNTSFATFGMTETLSHVALKKIHPQNNTFMALPNISFDVSDDHCLIITAPALLDAPIQTNDVVDLKDRFSFEWKGRKDFVINSGGVKIHPEAVEKRIEHLMSNPFYISKLDDNRLGEKVILYVESDPYDTAAINELNQKMRLVLDKYEVPKQIIFKAAFERTLSGKVKRN